MRVSPVSLHHAREGRLRRGHGPAELPVAGPDVREAAVLAEATAAHKVEARRRTSSGRSLLLHERGGARERSRRGQVEGLRSRRRAGGGRREQPSGTSRLPSQHPRLLPWQLRHAGATRSQVEARVRHVQARLAYSVQLHHGRRRQVVEASEARGGRDGPALLPRAATTAAAARATAPRGAAGASRARGAPPVSVLVSVLPPVSVLVLLLLLPDFLLLPLPPPVPVLLILSVAVAAPVVAIALMSIASVARRITLQAATAASAPPPVIVLRRGRSPRGGGAAAAAAAGAAAPWATAPRTAAGPAPTAHPRGASARP